MNNRNNSKSPSGEALLINLLNKDLPNSSYSKTIRISRQTTLQDVKQVLMRSENYQDFDFFIEKDQPIENTNELLFDLLKQKNLRTIYYQQKKNVLPRGRNFNNFIQNPKYQIINNNQFDLGRDGQQNKIFELTTNDLKQNYSVSPQQQNLFQRQQPQINNNQIITGLQQQIQSLNNSLQQQQIQYNDLQNQYQQLKNEKQSVDKQIRKCNLKIQDLNQENQQLINKNQQFFNELNLLKQEQSKLTNIQLENQFIKDEILQCHQLIEQILLEKQNLQQQIQQVVSEQNKFDNLQQENERLLQLIFELNEKAKFLSEDEKKRLNQKDMKQINVQNTIKKFQQCQNQQTIQYPKKINQISNSLNLDYVNKCGHKFSIQQLENIIFKAFTNKQIAHCDKCSQPIQEKLCLIIQCLGKFYIETKYKSNLLGIKKIINQKFNQNSEMLAICKNKKCNFFCIWNQTQDQLQSRQTYSFCLCCCEQSVINPFLPDQIQKEIMQRI